MTKEKSNNSYIQIIDETATEEYKKKQKNGTTIAYLVIGGILSSIPAILVGVASNSTLLVFIVWLILVIVFMVFVTIYDKNHIIKQPKKEQFTKREFDSKKLEELKTILKRVEYVTASICGGFIATPSEMKKYELMPPVYGAIKNPPIKDFNFIRVPNDLNDFSEEEKRIIEEAYGFKKSDKVIWVSKKSINKWTVASLIKSISFIDENGNKMYFLHTKYSIFRNLRELSIKDGICQIRIIN